MLRDQIKNQQLGWNVQPRIINHNEGRNVIYLLIFVHIFSFGLSWYMIGSKRYTNEHDRAQFPQKFKILTAVFLPLNVATAAVAFPTVLKKMDTMGHYYMLWIVTDVMLLFFCQFNVYVEFAQNHKLDHKLAEYVF